MLKELKKKISSGRVTTGVLAIFHLWPGLVEILQKAGVAVDFHDPLVPFLNINGLKQDGVPLKEKTAAGYDCVVVAVDHTSVDYKLVLRNARLVFDVKNVYRGVKSNKVVKL